MQHYYSNPLGGSLTKHNDLVTPFHWQKTCPAPKSHPPWKLLIHASYRMIHCRFLPKWEVYWITRKHFTFLQAHENYKEVILDYEKHEVCCNTKGLTYFYLKCYVLLVWMFLWTHYYYFKIYYSITFIEKLQLPQVNTAHVMTPYLSYLSLS